MASVETLVQEKSIVVCVGPGGVGKTTTAAAVGALAARRGRRTLVCTIDPAPRLADALGVGTLSPEPRPVPVAAARELGIGDHERLWAARLDTRSAFAALVEEQVSDPEMKRRIFANAIYRQITTTLTGSQEYAATLALYDLHRRAGFDLIVLDTPPTANALDFLEAPSRIEEAVSSPAIQWFARPEDNKRLSFRALRSGGAMVLHRLAKLVGSSFLDDLTAFFVDFHQVLGGFLTRARQIEALLREPGVVFLLVLAPELPAVDEALFFHERLKAAGLPLGAFIANRVHARPGLVDAAKMSEQLASQPALADTPRQTIDRVAERLARTALDFQRLWTSQRRELDRLVRSAPGVPVTEIPLLEHQVASLASLRVIGELLAL